MWPPSLYGTDTMEKLKVGGLRQSLELCQFDLRGPEPSDGILANVSRILASQKSNIAFLTYKTNKDRCCQVSFCLNQDLFPRASTILNKGLRLPTVWEIESREHVGMITVFPRHSAMTILGVVMASWGAESIPIYGIANSLSAVSFITDYRVIDKAVEVVQDSLQLPRNRAPIKPELQYYQSEVIKRNKT